MQRFVIIYYEVSFFYPAFSWYTENWKTTRGILNDMTQKKFCIVTMHSTKRKIRYNLCLHNTVLRQRAGN